MSFYGLINILLGNMEVIWTSRYPERILDDIRLLNLDVYQIRRAGVKSISFRIPRRHIGKMKRLLATKKEGKLETKMHGLPSVLNRYKMRAGFLAGILLAVLLMFMATRVVWSIEVEGQVRFSEEYIREVLSKEGVMEGQWLSHIHVEEKQLEILVKHPEISFVAINIYGNHLKVQIRERDREPVIGKDKNPYNLVAAVGGSIIRCEVLEGQTVVKEFQSVKEGDLLVSGLVDSQTQGYRIVHARGKIFARTSRTYTVTIPFKDVEKRYTGQETDKKTAIFLGKSINLYITTGISYKMYDTITTYNSGSLFGRNTLPIRTKTVTYLEYIETEITRNAERVRDLAYDAYQSWLAENLIDIQIENENIKENITEKGLTLTVDLVLIENIAREMPFTVG